MPAYAAFLRGINLGNRRVGGAALAACFSDLGLEDARAYQASGNVIFAAKREPVAKLTARIEQGLERGLGYEVPTFLRTAAEVRAIAGHEPFPARQVSASKGKLQVILLTAKPTAKARQVVLALATTEDPLAFSGRELYWLPSGGTLDSELDLKAAEKLLGTTTMRTQGTVERIAAKFFAG